MASNSTNTYTGTRITPDIRALLDEKYSLIEERMTSTVEDFWPDAINVTDDCFPLNIMRVQAQLLAGKTKGLLEASVKTIPKCNGLFICGFIVGIPALNYSVTLFTVTFTTYGYYVEQSNMAGKQIDKDEDFLAWFKDCLSNDNTTHLINQMAAFASAAE